VAQDQRKRCTLGLLRHPPERSSGRGMNLVPCRLYERRRPEALPGSWRGPAPQPLADVTVDRRRPVGEMGGPVWQR
jgi:hypothetical protein